MEPHLDAQLKRESEKYVGIAIYSTKSEGIKGKIKTHPTDFIVCEVTPDQEVLTVEPQSSFISVSDERLSSKKRRNTTFELVKKQEDTILAAQKIAGSLKIPLNNVTWAGLKDNRALTVQRMSVKGDYKKILSKLEFSNLFIKNVGYTKKPIRIGDLWGNKFDLIIRDISLNVKKNLDVNQSNNELENELIDVKNQINKNGFPNFYGLQRFGSHRPNSHLIGKLLFQENYQLAAEEFLFNSYPIESGYVKQCRDELKRTKDFSLALQKFPPGLYYELRMIQSLIKKPEKYKEAFKSLPKSLLNLLFSSYQSYLFNLAVSFRVKMGTSLDVPRKNDKIALLYQKRGLHSPIKFSYKRSISKHLEKLIQMEKATILCPVLGYETNLSEGYFGSIYRKILKQEKFSKLSFHNSSLSSLQYKGTERPIFVKPMLFSMKFVKKTKKNKNPFVKLGFMLPKGTYATMLVREFIK